MDYQPLHLYAMTPADYERALERKGRNVTDSHGPSVKAVSRLRRAPNSSDSTLDKHVNGRKK